MKAIEIVSVLITVSVVLAAFLAKAKASETVPWGVERIGARSLWDKDRNVIVDNDANAGNLTVAIVNTGVDIDHPDLQDNIVGGLRVYWDFLYNRVATSEDYDDTDGHGTEVAGVIAGTTPTAAESKT